MDIRFSGKSITVTPGMREHTEEKLHRLEKYVPRLMEAQIVLKKVKYLYDAQITVSAKDLKVYGEAIRKENVYAAVDQACERVEKQLKKFREKVKTHHKEHGENAVSPKVKMAKAIMKDAALQSPKPAIVRSNEFAPKPMSAEEASLQLEISNESFLVFLNAMTQKVNVIFKQPDGNHGLIEPEF